MNTDKESTIPAGVGKAWTTIRAIDAIKSARSCMVDGGGRGVIGRQSLVVSRLLFFSQDNRTQEMAVLLPVENGRVKIPFYSRVYHRRCTSVTKGS